MFYGDSWGDVIIESFMEKLDVYTRWDKDKRVKLLLGRMRPLNYRKSLELINQVQKTSASPVVHYSVDKYNSHID